MTDEDVQQTPSGSPDFRTELAGQLAELMPEVAADGKIDVEKLRELLAEDAGSESERFGLFWPGKRRALKAAQEPTTATLKPCLELSKDWDTTENVFIEGDNLEVLKILQRHYHGKIDIVYIDPPYNKGKDFIYPDNYREGLATYLEFTKQVDEGGKKLSSNSESEGRYHSNWLNMMYPRLKLARNLLAGDGLLMVSIDDDEHSNLKHLCDQVFGEDNFVAAAPRKTGAGSAATRSEAALRKLNDFVLIYTRSQRAVLKRKVVGQKDYPHEDQLGKFSLGQFQASGSDATRTARPNMWYPIYVTTGGELTTAETADAVKIIHPKEVNGEEGRWLWGREKFEADKGDFLHFDGETISRKIYLDETKDQTIYQVEKAWLEGFTNASGSSEVADLFGQKKIFDHPKPTSLIKHLLNLHPDKNAVVLDFFSGSGTTGDAVMQMNAADGGSRRHIQVQLPEPIPETAVAYRAGYRTIADLARKRIDLAGVKIKSELEGQLIDRDEPLDIGYRTYKLTDTNFAKWRAESDVAANELEQHLLDLRDSAADDATADDLLVEILLKQGHSLTERTSVIDVGGLDVRSVGDNLLLAYLDQRKKPTLDQLRALADLAEAKIVILEDAFQGDDELKTNMVQLCKTKKIDLWTA